MMQLEKILSAAVAAGNVDELDVDNLPSPDIPQASPGPPMACSTRRSSFHDLSCSVNLSSDKSIIEQYTKSSSFERNKPKCNDISSENKNEHKVCERNQTSSDQCIDIVTSDPLNVVSDELSLFNLGEDSLVITSQQALAMFENNIDDSHHTSATDKISKSVITHKENIKKTNTLENTSKQNETGSSFQTMESIGINDQSGDDVPAACGEIEIHTTDIAVRTEVNVENNEKALTKTNISPETNDESSGDSISNNLAKTHANTVLNNLPPKNSSAENTDILTTVNPHEINVPTEGNEIPILINNNFDEKFTASCRSNDAETSIHDIVPTIEELSIEKDTPTPNLTNLALDSDSIDLNTSQPEYTSLTPVSSGSSTTRLDDALGSLSGLDPPAGATIDATLDENGQFLVQVIAPGLNMTIPNQFLNKSLSTSNETYETYSQNNNNDLVDSLNHQIQDIEKYVNDERVTENSVKPIEKETSKRKRQSSPINGKTNCCKLATNNSASSHTIKHWKKDISNDCMQAKLKRKEKKKLKKKRMRKKGLNCVSPSTNTQFCNQINETQYSRQYPNLKSQPPHYGPYSNNQELHYSQYDPHFPVYNQTQPYAPYQNKPHIASNNSITGEENSWSIEEMLNSSDPMDLQNNSKLNTDSTNYEIGNNNGKNTLLNIQENGNDLDDMPIIMSPEEYHDKMKNGGQSRGFQGQTEIIQTTDTDGESLKVQLVYLVYPCKKKNGKRSDASDSESWSNERRQEQNGSRPEIHPHHEQQCIPPSPGPSAFSKPERSYVPHPQYGYGAPVPHQYHPYHREDPKQYQQMMRPPHNSAQTMYHQMHGLRQYMHLNQTQQMLQQQANQSIQANQSMPMPHNTFSPPQSISLSARDKTINWLSEAENQSPSPPSMANTHAPPNTESCRKNPKKVNSYQRQPMAEWQLRDVTHFLLEATYDLGIRYENSDLTQLSNINGKKLMEMEPRDFEKFTPGEGRKVYDYVQRNKNEEIITNVDHVSISTGGDPIDKTDMSISTPPPMEIRQPSIYQNDQQMSQTNLPKTQILEQSTDYDGTGSSTFGSIINYDNQAQAVNDAFIDQSISYNITKHQQTSQTFVENESYIYHSNGNSSSSELTSSTICSSMKHNLPAHREQNAMYQTSPPISNHSSAPYTPQGEPYSVPEIPQNLYSNRSYERHHSEYQQVTNITPQTQSKSFYPLHPSSNNNQENSNSDHNASKMNQQIQFDTVINAMSYLYEDAPDQDEDSTDDDEAEDDDDEEKEEQVADEDVKPPEPPKKRGPGRPPKPESERKKKKKKTGRLWEFIRNLLLNPETCPSIVKWENSELGVFRFVQSEKVAERWGMRKNNQKMNYEKLSRAMRYYYKGKVFEPVLGRRLVYKFGCNANGWKPNNGNFDT